MIERLRGKLSEPAPWIAIAGLMISGTGAFVGVWITFSQYHDDNLKVITQLQTTVEANSKWRAGLEQEHRDLMAKVSKIEGRLEEHLREDDKLAGEIRAMERR